MQGSTLHSAIGHQLAKAVSPQALPIALGLLRK
jgi:hypothetical protein